LKAPEDVRVLLTRRFAGKHREWLAQPAIADTWPLELSLSIPSEDEAYRDLEAVRAWIRAWQIWDGPGVVAWTERRWRSLGAQRMPEKLILSGPDDVASWAGQGARWKRAARRFGELTILWPVIERPLPRYFDVLADYSDEEFGRLIGMLKWIETNPNSNLYPRQIPVSGLDSKWLETRKGMITDLLTAIRGDSEGNQDFYSQCGLRPIPGLVRLRILDDEIRDRIGNLSDITAPPREIAGLTLPLERVYIVENVQSGLAFPDVRRAVLVMGLGYSVDLLGGISWMNRVCSIYWGDCDTHGFAILSRARTYLPNVQSVMMDEETLLTHKALWGVETEQHAARELSGLNAPERDVYRGLKEQRWGQNVRLEQERIAWDYAVRKLML
jgi:hypothetical protein